MSEIKTIEQLDETSASDLVGSDLLMTSVRNINGSYTSKKMTLSALADYVNSRESGGVTGFGGYEMIDTSEYGDGIYTAETISEYTSNRSKNYLWGLYIGNVAGTVSSLTKKVSKDCFVLIVNQNFKISIDDIELNRNGFNHLGGTYYSFYVKAEQELKLENPNNNYNFWVYIIPLKSGGRFYLDTSDPSKFYTGALSSGGAITGDVVATGDTDIFPGTAYMTDQTNNKPTIKVDRPTLFAYNYGGWGNIGAGQYHGQNYHNILNEKEVVLDEMNPHTNGASWVFLDTGDTFTPYTANPAGLVSPSQLDWIAYPLLSDAVRYVQLWENGPYWADRNIGAEKQEDFGQFFMPFQTTGYWQKNSGFTGEDGIRGFYFKRESNLPSEFYDVNQSSADLIFQKLIDSGYAEVYETDSSNRDVAKIKQQHDPAHVKLGNGWRLPTKEDFQQLIDNCSQSYDAVNGVYGIRFTSNADSSKSIFFPACGHAVGETSPLSSTGSSLPKDVQYLSSTITKYASGGTSNYKYADINIMNGSVGFASNGTPQISQATARSWQSADQWGWPIRPVKD